MPEWLSVLKGNPDSLESRDHETFRETAKCCSYVNSSPCRHSPRSHSTSGLGRDELVALQGGSQRSHQRQSLPALGRIAEPTEPATRQPSSAQAPCISDSTCPRLQMSLSYSPFLPLSLNFSLSSLLLFLPTLFLSLDSEVEKP